MDDSVGSAIEKIKLLEQDNENKLKEKREYEATVATLNRAIKDTLQHTEKIQAERAQLIKKIDCLRVELVIDRTRRDVLVAQVEVCKRELEDLKKELDHGITKVWKLRSGWCSTVHEVADECDVRALLIKPMKPESKPVRENTNFQENSSEIEKNKDALKVALERRKQAIAERVRLQAEPEFGEEYVRKCYRISRSNRWFSSKVKEELLENEPIKFSTSPAARKTTIPIIRTQQEMPWYQPYSVVASVSVFLIYFCVFREENDVDREFDKTLYDRIKGLEKQQLIQCYKFNKEHGKSVDAIEQRLKELEIEESKLVA